MECSCSAYGGDFDDDGVYSSSRELTARKEHQCYECQRTIKKGEKFTYHSIFSDGTIANFKVCATCTSIISGFFPNGWMFGSVKDELSDYLYFTWQEDLPSNCISKLTTAARDIVCDILQGFQDK